MLLVIARNGRLTNVARLFHDRESLCDILIAIRTFGPLCVLLHLDLRSKVLEITIESSDRKAASIQFVGDSTIVFFQASVDFDGIPFLCMTDIVDRTPNRLVQKNGPTWNRWRRPRMFWAATCPWSSANSQCSIRIESPVSASGQRATSPAAKSSRRSETRHFGVPQVARGNLLQRGTVYADFVNTHGTLQKIQPKRQYLKNNARPYFDASFSLVILMPYSR